MQAFLLWTPLTFSLVFLPFLLRLCSLVTTVVAIAGHCPHRVSLLSSLLAARWEHVMVFQLVGHKLWGVPHF